MGKAIIIKGADFSANAIGTLNPTTIVDLTTGATTGKYIDCSTGEISTLQAAAYTRRIQCVGYGHFLFNTTFYYSHLAAFYDIDGNFISGIKVGSDGNTSYTGVIPSGAFYIALNYKQSTPPVSLYLY